MSTPNLPDGLEDTLATRVANRLHSMAIHVLRRARQEDRATGLTPERLSLLSVLVFAGPRSVSELAEIEMVSRPAISRTLNALETQGLVRRERGKGDRRRVVAHATASGRRLMERGRRRRVERIAVDLDRLSARDLSTLDRATRVLEKLDRRPGR